MYEAAAIALVAAAGCLLLAFVVLTFVGARKRGAGATLSVVEALVFPFAWYAWYLRDGEFDRRRID